MIVTDKVTEWVTDRVIGRMGDRRDMIVSEHLILNRGVRAQA